MSNGSTTSATVSKRKPRTPKPSEGAEPPFERIEIHAPAGWTAKLDAAAAALGLNRSAYIRLACIEKMRRDREQGGEG